MKYYYIMLLICCVGCVARQQFHPDKEQLSLRLVDQGTALMHNGKLDQAQAAYQAAREINNSALAVDGLGCVAYRRGDIKYAERLFWEAYHLDHEYNHPLANLAFLYEEQGEHERALRLYREVLALEPEDVEARNNFAGFLANQKRLYEAREELLKAEALLPHPLIQNNIKNLE